MPGLRLDVGMKPRNLSFERRGARGDTSEAEMRRRGRQSKPRESAGRCLARLCSPLAALWRASGARGTEGCGESPPRLGRRRLAKCETVAGAAAAAVAQRAVHQDSLTRPVRDMSVDASRTWPTPHRGRPRRRASAPRTAANLRGGDTNSEHEGYETVSTAKCGRLRLRIRVLSSAGRNTRNSLRFWGQQAEQRLFTAWRVHGVG